jgi:hypothetical protein
MRPTTGRGPREAYPLPGPGTEHIRRAAELIKPVGWNRTKSDEERLAILQRPAVYWANLEVIRAQDFPLCGGLGPVMSNRMLEVLDGVASFERDVIPTRMLQHPDWTNIEPPWGGALNLPALESAHPTDVEEGYVIIRVPELDCANWGADEYGENSLLSVNEPADGFPPFFRIAGERAFHYLSGDACVTLKREQIRCEWAPAPLKIAE